MACFGRLTSVAAAQILGAKSGHIDMRILSAQVVASRVTSNRATCDGFRNRVSLIFDLLTSGSMHAERLLWSICLPSLALIHRFPFRARTHRQTRLNDLPTPAAMPAWVIITVW